MTDHEALQIIIKTTDLRVSAPYQAAEALRRASSAEAMARMEENSREHAAIRLLIGTWERIAMFVEDLNEAQRRRFFKCHPVSMVWLALKPAVYAIRQSGHVGPRFATDFEKLAGQYEKWTQTADGQEYRTEAQQAVCALFA
jgi:hypothetical protein